MTCVSCVAVDTDTEASDTEEVELSWNAPSRTTLKCMVDLARVAYDAGITSTCGYAPASGISSTSVTKVWTQTGAGTEDAIVIGFAGTHPLSIVDIILDVQSQITTTPENPLDNSLPSLGTVGQGWSTRWTNQATQMGVAAYLAKRIATQKIAGRGLHVYVTGHSLGGATATLASYDIAQYFKAHAGGVPYVVEAITFSSPRLGKANARDNYRKALLDSVCPGKNGQMCLRLKQFTRDLDPVPSLPVGETHAVWSPTAGDKSVGPDGPYAGKLLPYCPQLNAPKVSSWNSVANHSILNWAASLDAAPDSQLFCK